MAVRSAQGSEPPHFIRVGHVYVPAGIAKQAWELLAGERLDPTPGGSIVPPDADVPSGVETTARRLGRNRARKVFESSDVGRVEATVERLSRGSDRRKMLDAILKGLVHEPVGERALCRVPRQFRYHCELLRQEMPNFRQMIDRIEQLLMLQQAGDRAFRLPPILLAGPPGIGKTYFATRLAKLMQVPLEIFNMETATANWVLTGSDLGWGGGAPGLIFNQLVYGAVANPLIVLDELDKVSVEARYSPEKALYALLEPETAKAFRDEACRDVRLDASAINWIVTANEGERISEPLRNRLVRFDVPELTFEQRTTVVRCVYRDMRKGHAWGRRFEDCLSDRTGRALAYMDGSVRNLRVVLMSAFANAYARGSRSVEAIDVACAVSTEGKLVDLATAETCGHA